MAPYLSLTDQRRLRIQVPPIEVQRHVSGILGALDDKIELNRRMSKTTGQIADTIFASWFRSFEPVRAKMAETGSGLPAVFDEQFPGSFEDSDLGPIPAGWKVATLGQLFPNDPDCVLTGPFGTNLHARDYHSEGVPLILVKHVGGGGIDDVGLPLVREEKARQLARYQVRVGDIVFTRVGAVGRSAYVHDVNAGWLVSWLAISGRQGSRTRLDAGPPALPLAALPSARVHRHGRDPGSWNNQALAQYPTSARLQVCGAAAWLDGGVRRPSGRTRCPSPGSGADLGPGHQGRALVDRRESRRLSCSAGAIGWTVAHGPEIAVNGAAAERSDPGYRDVTLEGRLRRRLARLNPGLPAEAVEEAFRKLTRTTLPTLLERNRALHRMLVDGVTVEYRRSDGSVAGAQARVIDFERPSANDWLAVNQFTVIEGGHERRPDVVLFLNGLPVAVIELKNPADEAATIWSAFNQLRPTRRRSRRCSGRTRCSWCRTARRRASGRSAPAGVVQALAHDRWRR